MENESGELKAAVTEIDNSPAIKSVKFGLKTQRAVRRINPLRHSLDLISLITKAEWKNQSGYLPEIYKLDNQVDNFIFGKCTDYDACLYSRKRSSV